MSVFWLKGYAATSTDDLLRAMKIGRQSMYDTFGDKWRLYVEALERYQDESIAANINRLRSTTSPLAGIETLVVGLIASDRAAREKGCMGVGSICEFGNADIELSRVLLRVLPFIGGPPYRATLGLLRANLGIRARRDLR
jgi:TetR/AcrR family transcriptional regulator, transcriptional repressor for nem operon